MLCVVLVFSAAETGAGAGAGTVAARRHGASLAARSGALALANDSSRVKEKSGLGVGALAGRARPSLPPRMTGADFSCQGSAAAGER